MPSDMAKRVKRQSARQGEAKRDVWQEVLDGVREIRAGGGRRTVVNADSPVAQIRQRSGLSQEQFAAALGVSKRTLEQWEQGRRRPSGAARTLLKIVDRHPEVLIELAA
jgi:putative transcriptional regulator